MQVTQMLWIRHALFPLPSNGLFDARGHLDSRRFDMDLLKIEKSCLVTQVIQDIDVLSERCASVSALNFSAGDEILVAYGVYSSVLIVGRNRVRLNLELED